MPNVSGTRDPVSSPDDMDETVLHKTLLFMFLNASVAAIENAYAFNTLDLKLLEAVFEF